MRIAFFGTSEFAVPLLQRIPAEGHEVVAVVTQPARPKGRGRKLEPSPVESAAASAGLPVLTPADPNAEDFLSALAGLKPELGVLAAYGCILKQALLELPERGFINLHPSLLPAYRGAAPIQRALMDGSDETGVTVIRMSRRVDAGDVLNRKALAIGPDETAGELSARLAGAGAELVARTMQELAAGEVQSIPQDPSRATPAPKLADSERLIDWTRPARALHNLIRALSPKPAAYTFFRSKRVLVLRSALGPDTGPAVPGAVLTDLPGLAVAAGTGTLSLLEIKPEAGKVQSGPSFRNGYRPMPEERFENS